MPKIQGVVNEVVEQVPGGAVREAPTGKGRFDLVSPFSEERIAKWFEAGAKKYAERNWEKGIMFSRYLDSAKRHINKFQQGDDSEDHLAAACWNLMCIMHHQEMYEEDRLNDLPNYHKIKQMKL